ncbi:hypothetical protein DFH06DRAFT_1132882 [Mycena polygramma]|nr:hypothetical protein DFH06DRAFT_1132882 [Mycena polygramma]
MSTSRPNLRPLLPMPPSAKRPEPFLLKISATGSTTARHVPESNNPVHAKPQSEFERRSLGQKKRRERELKENKNKPKHLKSVNPSRSAVQRARRQRELASTIEGLLQNRECENIRSRAQTLRRRVEEGERRLDVDPECDPTQALDQALDYEYEVNEPRRQDSHFKTENGQTMYFSSRIGHWHANYRTVN